MEELYQYTPFTDSNSIRLLYLWDSVNKEDVGNCQLKTVSLGDLPSFRALSYTWGNSAQTHSIRIDGKRIPITSNLVEALDGIQKNTEVRVVWADAICINQNDVHERTQQVQLMGTIYHQATQVLIWLGPENNDVLPALNLLMQMADIAIEEFSSGDYSQIVEQRLPSSSQAEEWGLPAFSDPAWQSLIRLCLRPWFKRVWVVQEVRVASDAIVLCGKIEVSWLPIYIASSWFAANNYKLPLERRDDYLGRSAGVVQLPNRIGCHRRNVDDQIDRLPLSQVLRSMRAHMATDPRDKVFALVELSIEGQKHDPLLMPDYAKSLAHVYRDVSRYLINAGSLDVLSAVSWIPDPRRPLSWKYTTMPGKEHGVIVKQTMVWGPPDESVIFPSWVPRWDYPNIPWPLVDSIEQQNLHNATGHVAMHLIESSDADALILRGMVFDHVARMTKIKRDPDAGEEPVQVEEYMEWREMSLEAHSYPVNDRIVAFHCTLTAGMTINRHPVIDDVQHMANILAFETKMLNPDTSTPQAHESQFSEIDASTSMNNKISSMSISSTTEVTPDVATEPELEPEPEPETLNPNPTGDPSAYAQLVQIRSKRRHLFITTGGHMGLGPEGMGVGDTVCILFGGLTPYVLRKRESKRCDEDERQDESEEGAREKAPSWQFIGECYVHGYMDGEAVLGINSDDPSPGEVFEIR